MSETVNYGLHLTDDNSEKFHDWRTKMNGTEDSNMVIIDTVLGEKAEHSKYVNTTLLSTGWSGVEAPFVQEIAVDGLGEVQNGYISVAHSATPDQRDVARCAMLAVSGQKDGALTIVADGELPDLDIPVCIILLG